jgi:RNA 3'-terminal phosphate cyclase (ATP)
LTQPIRIDNIRAGRKNPGLAAQHLTAARAAAAICNAHLAGDRPGSTQLTFKPQSSPLAGVYKFDVAEAREGGSAGAASLVLQTVLLPLAWADKASVVTVKGGTHVAWSPPFHYLRDVYLPMLACLGVQATAELLAWGWYPVGNGEITATISGQTTPGESPGSSVENFGAMGSERGPLKQIKGVAVASSLPAHIAQRMRNKAVKLLQPAGLPADIKPQRVRSVSPGAGLFLLAEYQSSRAGFSALGRKGKPAERVAQEAVNDLLAFHQSGAALDQHLADQLILPLALSALPGPFQVERLSQHTLTNIWVVEQFLGPLAEIDHQRGLIRFTQRERVLP